MRPGKAKGDVFFKIRNQRLRILICKFRNHRFRDSILIGFIEFSDISQSGDRETFSELSIEYVGERFQDVFSVGGPARTALLDLNDPLAQGVIGQELY